VWRRKKKKKRKKETKRAGANVGLLNPHRVASRPSARCLSGNHYPHYYHYYHYYHYCLPRGPLNAIMLNNCLHRNCLSNLSTTTHYYLLLTTGPHSASSKSPHSPHSFHSLPQHLIPRLGRCALPARNVWGNVTATASQGGTTADRRGKGTSKITLCESS
jgi:hypothetical protein